MPPQENIQSKGSERDDVDASLKKGFKYGVRFVERSHFVDENGELWEDQMQMHEEHHCEEIRYSENKFLQAVAKCLVWLRCIPLDPTDFRTMKTSFLWMQWLAIISDAVAASFAIVTFQQITYCCEMPILDIARTFSWTTTVRVSTVVYLILVLAELYPAVFKGIPINLMNPTICFFIASAMVFNDMLRQAMLLWAVQSLGVAFEFILIHLKFRQRQIQKQELVRVGRMTKTKRDAEEGEDPNEPE